MYMKGLLLSKLLKFIHLLRVAGRLAGGINKQRKNLQASELEVIFGDRLGGNYLLAYCFKNIH